MRSVAFVAIVAFAAAAPAQIVLPSLGAIAKPPVPDSAKFRAAIQLPGLFLGFGVRFDETTDRFELGEKPELSNAEKDAEIARLVKELTGTPADGERHAKIGELFGDRREKSRNTHAAKAVECYRERLTRTPADAPILGLMANALGVLRKDAEAERCVRDAVGVAPDDWRAWRNLATFLTGQALAEVSSQAVAFGARAVAGKAPPDAMPSKSILPTHFDAGGRPIRDILAEIHRCYDRAAELAPREPILFQDRACFAMMDGFFAAAMRGLAGDDDGMHTAIPGAITSSMDEFARAGKCRPDDPHAILMLYWLGHMTRAARPGDAANPESLTAKASLARLAPMTTGDDRVRAGRAALAACWVAQLDGDVAELDKSTRLAIELTPNDDDAWLLRLSHLLTNRPAEFVAACRARLATRDIAPLRLLLARGLSRAGDWAGAEAEIRAARTLSPDDLETRFYLAILRIRSGELAEAEELLRHVSKKVAAVAGKPGRKSEAESRITRLDDKVKFGMALIHACQGETMLARMELENLTGTNPGVAEIAAALEALR